VAVHRKRRRNEGQIAFEALSIEGGLLSPEWLARIALLEAGGQSEADYGIPKGLNIRDEVGRYWRIARAHCAEFNVGIEKQAAPGALAERFVSALLRDALGFGSLEKTAPIEIAGRSFPIGFSALHGRVPVVIAPAGSDLDLAAPSFGEPGRRRSAFGLAQEYLNAADGSLWGIASDGLTLRILRDNASLTRPAWIEADLSRIFTGDGSFADFTVLWLLAHETRFGRADQPATSCALETWREAGREEGTRAREHLRTGVEMALRELGTGFLAHPFNVTLRAALADGSLTTMVFFQQLLRLVYRLIFLLTAEERGLLHPDSATTEARTLYGDGYGLRRLRERAARRSAHDRFPDLWEGLKIAFRGLAHGEPRLGLPALAGLFAADRCPALDAAKIENRALLGALFRLSWLREKAGLSRVNWRDMGPEEMGSVYESLLELVPQITGDGRVFGFATGAETKGNTRKTTGSYYTPDSLVQVLLQSALEPVIENTIAAHPKDGAEALLSLSIVDPACGSGHFLLAAARRLAGHVARLQVGGTPSASEYRHALRQVVGRCLYGVDLNPMAVELCKVSLWMEAVEPGRPLSFLDSHIQLGNALLGTTPALMEKGIPDEAWDPIEGDDRKVASILKKRNKKAGAGQRGLDLAFSTGAESESAKVTRAIAELESISDFDIASLARKTSEWQGVLDSEAYRHQKFIADSWCAAFVWPKQPGPYVDAAPTNDLWRQFRDRLAEPSGLVKTTVAELASQYHFSHWHLAFPRVFDRGGFDVVLGNPPWDRVKLQEQEFFASRDAEIATASNAAARKKLIAALPESNPILWSQWSAASREAEGQSHFIRNGGRYPLCGRGDVNTYALFAEHNRDIASSHGRAGFIVPGGIAADDTTKDYFQQIVSSANLSALYHFENEDKVFPGIHHASRFVLLTLDRSGRTPRADLVFYARQVTDLLEAERHFSLSPDDFALLNPNTRTCPTFRSRRDAELNLALYRRTGVLWRESAHDGNPWGLRFLAMFHMANDSGLFRTRAEMEAPSHALIGNQFDGTDGLHLPLFEAKMVHHFDHRFGTYEGQTGAQVNQGKLPELSDSSHLNPEEVTLPEYWVKGDEVEARLRDRWSRGWLLGWRDITGSEKQRTVIASLIPRSGTGHTFLLAMPSCTPALVSALYANLCSFALDYAARQKVGGTHLTFHTFRQLPVLFPEVYSQPAAEATRTIQVEWILPRVLELTYTAWDLESFARDVGYAGAPFRWDSKRRFLLRAELDAAFFHLYGISRDDAAYILDSFPVVKKNDEKAHGEYRTKRVILEIYDALSEATRSRRPYETRLDPPPADPRVAHPPRNVTAVPRANIS
jgi:N-6 DNA Methylase